MKWHLWVAIFGLIVLQAHVLGRPSLTVQMLVDDNYPEELSAAMLCNFFANFFNQNPNIYPFDIRINTYLAGSTPEAFQILLEVCHSANNSTLNSILGPRTSNRVSVVSSISQIFEAPLIAYAASNDEFSLKADFPSVWRTCNTDNTTFSGILQLMLSFQWVNFIHLYDSHLSFVSPRLLKDAHKVGMKAFPLGYTAGVESSLDNALHQLSESPIRIIVATANDPDKILPYAIKYNVIGPDSGYIWIWATPLSTALSVPELQFSITTTLNFESLQVYNNIDTFPSQSEAYNYVQYLFEAVDPNNPWRKGQNISQRILPPFDFCWDSVNSLLAAQGLFAILAAQNTYFTEFGVLATGPQLQYTLSSVEADALGTFINFDASQDNIGYKIYFAQYGPTGSFPSGWSATWLPGTKLQSLSWSWPGDSVFPPGDGVTPQSFIHMTSLFGVLGMVLAIIAGVLALIILCGLIYFFKTPIMSYGSPLQMFIGLTSLSFYIVSAVLHIGPISHTVCTLRYWFYFAGFTTGSAALIAKNWRIYAVYKSIKRKNAMIISNRTVFFITVGLVFPILVILICRAVFAPSTEHRILSSDHTRVILYCGCLTDNETWLYACMFYAVVILISDLTMAALVRPIAAGFYETKFIFYCELISAPLSASGLFLSNLTNPTNAILAATFGIVPTLLVSILKLSLLFMPKIVIAIFKPSWNKIEHITGHTDDGTTMTRNIPAFNNSVSMPLNTISMDVLSQLNPDYRSVEFVN